MSIEHITSEIDAIKAKMVETRVFTKDEYEAIDFYVEFYKSARFLKKIGPALVLFSTWATGIFLYYKK